MDELTPRELALSEFHAMERQRWSEAEWPRVLAAAGRVLDAMVRYQVRAAMGVNERAGEDKSD